jgi:hypothetical protein
MWNVYTCGLSPRDPCPNGEKRGFAMSLYHLQKMIRDVNRVPERRESYFRSSETFVRSYDLSAEERDAFVQLDIAKLYQLGVHGLLLRPFTILHKIPEAAYLTAIRGEG